MMDPSRRSLAVGIPRKTPQLLTSSKWMIDHFKRPARFQARLLLGRYVRA